MKLLLVSFYFYPEIGAAPSRIKNMADGFREQGASVDVLTCLPNYPKGRIFDGYRHRIFMKEPIENGTIFRYWTYATVSKKAIPRALSMLSFAFLIWMFAFKFKRIKNYDAVIIQSPPLFVSYSAVLLFKCLYHKKTILNISDLWPLSAVELGAIRSGSKIHKIFSYIEKFIYKRSDGIFGQSNEILAHIRAFDSPAKLCLYRNFQRYNVDTIVKRRHTPMKIVYAGLLGVGQDILEMVKSVNFKALGVEFHIYGGGNQAKDLEEYIDSHESNVYYHGYVNKSEMAGVLSGYDASIVPLAVRIKGAVPSKIFDILPIGLPVLFCGGGEGAEIVKEYGVGYVSDPGDFNQLSENLVKLKNLTDEEYEVLSAHCIEVSKVDFSFDMQMKRTCSFLKNIINS